MVALGITLDGTKVTLALAEGASENATVVRDLLAGLRDRGLETTRPILVVIDDAKALRRAVLDVFDHPVIQRCQLHKLRNVTDRLPDAVAATVAKRLRAAYRQSDPLVAQADLAALARELDRSYPGAAASLREGLAETLTIGRLGVPPTLARTLRSTNSIESMIAICRDHAANVKCWRDGQMVLRWVAAGMGRRPSSSTAAGTSSRGVADELRIISSSMLRLARLVRHAAASSGRMPVAFRSTSTWPRYSSRSSTGSSGFTARR